LRNFLSFECYVDTACPRMADDSERFGRPILDIGALKELLALKGKK
jgi:diphthamide synthase subunit DPH2